jgi:hypothetical protein
VAAATGLLLQMQQQQQLNAAASMDMDIMLVTSWMGCRCCLAARVWLLLQVACLVRQMQQQQLELPLLLPLREVRGIKAGSTFLSA